MGNTSLSIDLYSEDEMIAYLRWARMQSARLNCEIDEIWQKMAEEYRREEKSKNEPSSEAEEKEKE